MKKILAGVSLALICLSLGAQKYSGLIDKTVAVIGGEFVSLSDLEQEVSTMRARGYASDQNLRCEILENILQSKLLLMQARVDSLTVNKEMVGVQLNQHIDEIRTALGGDEKVEEYFGKPIYKLRQEWNRQFEEMSLTQQEQQEIARNIPEITPYDIRQYVDTADVANLPVIPAKYQMSQICVYPDVEAAKLAAKEKLLELRERIIAGEKFSTLARLYSDDIESAKRGGELGMASKTMFWPQFSDAAMSLKVGMVSNTVETPDGFHLIQIIEKKGDMFNARHILIKPRYTSSDREKAFARLDSLRALIDTTDISFETAARLYSQDKASRTNGGQMADPGTGSAYFDKDQIKPADWAVISKLEPGQISEPVESTDNEGRNGNLVYKIIRLDKIVPSHTASFETDYNELYGLVENTKQMEAINKFIDKKISETHIVIDPMFKDCDFSRAGWSEKIRK
ncbi:MAG: peptidylprolyl isomerase [Bacteroidales bacterium]|nr:peptidylprolyl isomerase [Bacteroidales bacterium]